jgi:hypothetical protein
MIASIRPITHLWHGNIGTSWWHVVGHEVGRLSIVDDKGLAYIRRLFGESTWVCVNSNVVPRETTHILVPDQFMNPVELKTLIHVFLVDEGSIETMTACDTVNHVWIKLGEFITCQIGYTSGRR